MEMAWVRGRLGDLEWWRALRYSAVSVVGIVVTQAVLVGAHAVAGMAPILANTIAVSVAAIPVFFLNRAWVWQLSGRGSFRREVLPFWGFTLAGLVLSTLAVAAVSSMTTSTLAVSAANTKPLTPSISVLYTSLTSARVGAGATTMDSSRLVAT